MSHFNCDNKILTHSENACNDKKRFIDEVEYDLRNTSGVESIDFEYNQDRHNLIKFNTYLTHVKDFEPKFNQFIELVKSYKKVRENL